MLIRSVVTLALFLAGTALWSADAAYLGSYKWSSEDVLHGGFSGLEVGKDGVSFTTITDQGSIATGIFARDKDGNISDITTMSLTPLQSQKAKTLPRYHTDSEGLAIAPSGELYVSFEAKHRVWRYADPASQAKPLPKHADFDGMQLNSSLEALAIDQNGTLFTLPERSGSLTVDFPVYRFQKGKWDIPFTLPRRGEYLPVGMDIGPDGNLYLLERWFRGIGFTSRVRRFNMTKTGLTQEETLIETSLGAHDNLEGISAWQDGDAIRLTMISDDNFKFFQVTEFVEYLITE